MLPVLLAFAIPVIFPACSPTPHLVDISIDPATRYQTMSGWEATAQAGQQDAAYTRYRDTLMRLATEDLGINRLRLEVRSGTEHTRDYRRERQAGRLTGDDFRCARYETANDNDDPQVINWAGFQFTELDETIEALVLPLQRALASRGEQLSVVVTYVSFLRQCPRDARYDHRNASEYAEFVLATLLHIRERYALVPALWEIILEPDNTDDWDGIAIGHAIVEASARLAEHGFVTRFVAPSNTSMATAVRDYQALRNVPGAKSPLSELSYHRYRGVSRGVLQSIGELASRDTIRTAMLEYIGADVDDLFDDLTIGQVSAWSQYALAIPIDGRDDGGLYYRVDTAGSLRPVVHEGKRTRFLRQVFRAARLGAIRIAASSNSPSTRAVAFLNTDNRLALAIRTTRATRLTIAGLGAGRHSITYATRTDAHGILDDAMIVDGQPLNVTMPAAGVLTVIAR